MRGRSQAKNWAGHIAAQSQSGVSIAEYCRNHGLDSKAFSYQRNRAIRNGINPGMNQTPEERFIPIHSTKSREIRIELGKGAVMIVPEECLKEVVTFILEK
jgi:transposase-like protein